MHLIDIINPESGVCHYVHAPRSQRTSTARVGVGGVHNDSVVIRKAPLRHVEKLPTLEANKHELSEMVATSSTSSLLQCPSSKPQNRSS